MVADFLMPKDGISFWCIIMKFFMLHKSENALGVNISCNDIKDDFIDVMNSQKCIFQMDAS